MSSDSSGAPGPKESKEHKDKGIKKFWKKLTNQTNGSQMEEEVMSILEAGQESGVLKEEGKKMINSIFALDDKLAYEIMTPRTDVFVIDIEDPPEEYVDDLMKLRYSRIPVCQGETDNIIGILNIKDYLIQAWEKGFESVDIASILRAPYFVPETKNIDALLFELQKMKQQIAILIDEYGGFWNAFRYSLFQVSSLMTTTGFATADFTLWPAFSKSILILVMLIGASAGSTGGGLKVSRIIIFFKSSAQEIGKMLNPRRTSSVRINGHSLPAATIRNTLVFISLYFLLTFVFTAIVSLDGYDFETTFASVVSCMSNVGPGLGPAGPMGSYDIFSDLSKVIMSFAMLAGRLEIFPMLILFAPATWRRH